MKPILSDQVFRELLISFRLRHLQELDAFFHQVNPSFERLKEAKELTADEKISLRNYAIMRDFAALQPFLPDLQQTHVYLCDKIGLCHEVVVYFERSEEGYLSEIDFFMKLSRLVRWG